MPKMTKHHNMQCGHGARGTIGAGADAKERDAKATRAPRARLSSLGGRAWRDAAANSKGEQTVRHSRSPRRSISAPLSAATLAKGQPARMGEPSHSRLAGVSGTSVYDLPASIRRARTQSCHPSSGSASAGGSRAQAAARRRGAREALQKGGGDHDDAGGKTARRDVLDEAADAPGARRGSGRGVHADEVARGEGSQGVGGAVVGRALEARRGDIDRARPRRRGAPLVGNGEQRARRLHAQRRRRRRHRRRIHRCLVRRGGEVAAAAADGGSAGGKRRSRIDSGEFRRPEGERPTTLDGGGGVAGVAAPSAGTATGGGGVKPRGGERPSFRLASLAAQERQAGAVASAEGMVAVEAVAVATSAVAGAASRLLALVGRVGRLLPMLSARR